MSARVEGSQKDQGLSLGPPTLRGGGEVVERAEREQPEKWEENQNVGTASREGEEGAGRGECCQVLRMGQGRGELGEGIGSLGGEDGGKRVQGRMDTLPRNFCAPWNRGEGTWAQRRVLL